MDMPTLHPKDEPFVSGLVIHLFHCRCSEYIIEKTELILAFSELTFKKLLNRGS